MNEGKRKHRLLDHPVLGYFVLTLASVLVIGIFALLFTKLLEPLSADFGQAAAFMLASLIYFGWYRFHFRPDFKGTLTFKRFWKGVRLMIIPFGLICAVNTVQSVQSGLTSQFGKALGLALVAGIGEEAMFRTTGISNFMRVERRGERIPVILWLSALVFGFGHLANIKGGASLVMTATQVLSSSCAGVFFGAVYLRTANVWPCILAHTLNNFTCFIEASLLEDEGILVSSSLTLSDGIILALDVVLLIVGLVITSKKHREEILRVWDEQWGRS